MHARISTCDQCSAPVTQKPKGRIRHYCTPACRQRAFVVRMVARERAAAVAEFATAIQHAVVAGQPVKLG